MKEPSCQVVFSGLFGWFGQVVTSAGVPVVGLEVQVLPGHDDSGDVDDLPLSTVTDNTGHFSVGGLRAGRHQVEWLGDGVLVASTLTDSSGSVVLAAGQNTVLPAPLVAFRSGSLTGADGSFVVPGLPAGGVLVFVDGGSALVGRYADGAAFEETSTPISLTPPGVVNLGQVVLPPAALIDGEVTDPDGEAVADAVVYAFEATSGGSDYPVEAAQTGEDGHYEIGGLAAGDYELVVVPAGTDPDQVELAAQTVQVNTTQAQVPSAAAIQLPAQSATSMTGSQTQSSQIQAVASSVPAERWVIGSYNIGQGGYNQFLVKVNGGLKECEKTACNNQPEAMWSKRAAGVMGLKKAQVSTGGKNRKPMVVAVQEAGPKLVTVGGKSTTQAKDLVSRMKAAGYLPAVSLDTLGRVKADLKNYKDDKRAGHAESLLFYDKALDRVASGTYYGAQLVNKANSKAVAGYLNMMITGPKAVPDRVFPWAVLKKSPKAKNRNQFMVVASIHATPWGYLQEQGTKKSNADYLFYSSMIIEGLASLLEETAGNKGPKGKLPITIAGDFNGRYRTADRNGSPVKAMPKALADKGYTDTRFAKTGCKPTQAAFTANAHCTNAMRTIKDNRAIDFIFVKNPGGTISVGKFHTKADKHWWSDHKMIATDVLLSN